MARQLVVLAVIFVAIIGMAMADQVAPSASPKSSPSSKAASPSSKSSPSPKSSPPTKSPLSSPPSPTSSDESNDFSISPAPSSDPIELYAPEPEPFDDPFAQEETADVTGGASSVRQVSVIVIIAVAVAGLFTL